MRPPLAPPPQSEIGGPQWRRWFHDLWERANATPVPEYGLIPPAVTFATPGDLEVEFTGGASSRSRISYVRCGPLLCIQYRLRFIPTFTTAAGELWFPIPESVYQPGAGPGNPITGMALPSDGLVWPEDTSYFVSFLHPEGTIRILGVVEGAASGQALLADTHIPSGVEQLFRGYVSVVLSEGL